MSYFRNTILPPADKKNVAGFSGFSGAMLAEDYNLHNEELRAIETFLGSGDPTDDQVETTKSLSPLSENVLNTPAYLARAFNRLISNSIACTSGTIHSGRRIVFPYEARATFLLQPALASARTIKVVSTEGFPTIGIVSILHDVPISSEYTAVEWIAYNGKTDTEFLNCRHGDSGTTVANHGTVTESTDRLNAQTCQALNVCAVAYDSRYPAWRNKDIYVFTEFGLEDDLVSMKKEIRQSPESYVLTKQLLGSNYDMILRTASSGGILSADSAGRPVLRSADTTYAAVGELSWQEASDFVDSLVNSNSAATRMPVIRILKSGSEWNVGNPTYIPVFGGRMSVSYSLAAATLSPSSATTFKTFLQAPSIYQSADGTVRLTMSQTTAGMAKIIQGVINYKTFFVGNMEGV